MVGGPESSLAAFLRARRQTLSPQAVGYPLDGRRRVAGLRREEVAVLAGLSADYYARLEQGRVGQPSTQVLSALADALQLDPAQREHLERLVQRSASGPRSGRRPTQTVRASTHALLDALTTSPAFLIGRRTEILACNALGAALHGNPLQQPRHRRSCAWLLFLDPPTRRLYPDWSQVARDTVGALRRDAGRHPDDPELAALVEELAVKDQDFRRWWGEHHVHAKASGTKRFDHPVVGPLTLTHESLVLADDPDLLLLVYSAPPDSTSAEALRVLGSWAATEDLAAR